VIWYFLRDLAQDRIMDRRSFVRRTAVGAGIVALDPSSTLGTAGAQTPHQGGNAMPAAVRALRPMTAGIVPISDAERRARIAKAQRLMTENQLDAVFMESGTSMNYFVNVRWGLSERPFGVIIPAQGEIAYISPGFEEARARELIRFSKDVRVWQEDESPYALIAKFVKERSTRFGRVGIEERTRFFIADGIRRDGGGLQVVSADAVTAGCRMFKSAAEIALMQRANDITLAAYKAGLSELREGMTPAEISAQVSAAFRALGSPAGSASVQIGENTAYPHGSTVPQRLKRSDVVLTDGGCDIEGYRSDITRTIVFGPPTKRQRDVWDLEKRAQTAAFNAARLGATCESVDAAARKVITDGGFGPGYKVPGLPHRTGHGIGMDGHEWTNFVKGNTTKLQPGMCFSDEPMIAIYGEFGIRLEDCLHMTESGAKFFTPQSLSIDQPFG
jgi:Xaa-Pro dipeptidase